MREEKSGGAGSRTDSSDTPVNWANATAETWRSAFGEENPEPVADHRLAGGAEELARDLLGSVFISTVGAMKVRGVVVETEAYVGPRDPASHAAARIGRTRRNSSMFGPGGTAYVYRSYGIHWCLNVVSGEEGFPAAVLIRGVDPIVGVATVRDRRGGKEPLCAGPGRVCQALGITGALDGHLLTEPPLRLRTGWRFPDEHVGVSGRVGIRHAADWPLRFYLRGHPQVTRVGVRAQRATNDTESDDA